MKVSYRPGCGPACHYRDWVSGICERHGPTEADRIVEAAVEGFRQDMKRILKGARAKVPPTRREPCDVIFGERS